MANNTLTIADGVRAREGSFITLDELSNDGGIDLAIERNEHLGGEVSYYVLASDVGSNAGVKLNVAQAAALRDWLIKTVTRDEI